MNTSLFLSVAAVVVVCLLLVFAVRSRRRGAPMIVQQNPLPHMSGSLGVESRRIDLSLGREILRLLEEGEKAQAVALVRERTGWGPQEASEAVGRLEGLKKRLEL